MRLRGERANLGNDGASSIRRRQKTVCSVVYWWVHMQVVVGQWVGGWWVEVGWVVGLDPTHLGRIRKVGRDVLGGGWGPDPLPLWGTQPVVVINSATIVGIPTSNWRPVVPARSLAPYSTDFSKVSAILAW